VIAETVRVSMNLAEVFILADGAFCAGFFVGLWVGRG
jgi:hypothetical protein